MDQSNLIELLGQANACEAGQAFREFLRGGVRLMLADVMAAEVSELCGSNTIGRPSSTTVHAPSRRANALWEGQRQTVRHRKPPQREVA